MSQILELVLVRHTESTFNAEHRYTGHIDVSLTPHGIEQATQLAETLSNMSFSMMACSDLRRTRQVAQLIAQPHQHLPILFDRRLREVDIGAMSGLTKEEARQRYPEPHHRTVDTTFNFRDIGGEHAIEVVERQLEVLTCIARALPQREATIAIIGHGTALRLLVTTLGFQWRMRQGEFQSITFEP